MNDFIRSLLILLVVSLAPKVWAKDTVVAGIPPWDKPENLQNMYQPLMDYLGSKLNKKFQMLVVKDYKALENLMKQKQIDLGFYTPQAYVLAKKEIPNLRYLVTHLTRNENDVVTDYYEGLILALKSSKLKSVTDLKDKVFAFTSIDSASGYLYPVSLLKQKGIDPNSYFKKTYWLKKHHRVVGAIAKGSVDAGATWDGEFINAKKKYGDIYRILAQTDPIPNDPIVAAPHIELDLATSIQRYLLELNEQSPTIKKMRQNGFPDVGFSKRSDQFYDVVRKLGE